MRLEVQPVRDSEVPSPANSATPVYQDTPPPQSEFYDTFQNNALGWSVSSNAGYFRTVNPGALILKNTNPGTTMIESLPTNEVFDNFTIIVDFTILQAGLNDSVGIFLRGDTDLEHDYRVNINGDGTIEIDKEYLDSKNNSQSVILVESKGNAILEPVGEQNTLSVTINGSQLQLFINNVRVNVVTDSDYQSGQVALFAQLDKNSHAVAVSFSRVELDKIPGV